MQKVMNIFLVSVLAISAEAAFNEEDVNHLRARLGGFTQPAAKRAGEAFAAEHEGVHPTLGANLVKQFRHNPQGPDFMAAARDYFERTGGGENARRARAEEEEAEARRAHREDRRHREQAESEEAQRRYQEAHDRAYAERMQEEARRAEEARRVREAAEVERLRQERVAHEQAKAKAQAEAERLRQQQEEATRQERLRQQQEQDARRKAQEEADRKARESAESAEQREERLQREKELAERKARQEREDAEKKAELDRQRAQAQTEKEQARAAREKAEEDRLRREEAARRQQEETARKVKEEADRRKAKEEADRREQARKAQEEADRRKAKEEADRREQARKAQQEEEARRAEAPRRAARIKVLTRHMEAQDQQIKDTSKRFRDEEHLESARVDDQKAQARQAAITAGDPNTASRADGAEDVLLQRRVGRWAELLKQREEAAVVLEELAGLVKRSAAQMATDREKEQEIKARLTQAQADLKAVNPSGWAYQGAKRNLEAVVERLVQANEAVDRAAIDLAAQEAVHGVGSPLLNPFISEIIRHKNAFTLIVEEKARAEQALGVERDRDTVYAAAKGVVNRIQAEMDDVKREIEQASRAEIQQKANAQFIAQLKESLSAAEKERVEVPAVRIAARERDYALLRDMPEGSFIVLHDTPGKGIIGRLLRPLNVKGQDYQYIGVSDDKRGTMTYRIAFIADSFKTKKSIVELPLKAIYGKTDDNINFPAGSGMTIDQFVATLSIK